MNKIAIFTQDQTISYTAIVITIAILTTVICAVLTAAFTRKSVTAVLTCAGISMVLAPLCSRAVYWYCLPEQFNGIGQMFSDMSSGGYCLPGAIIGVILSAVITWKTNIADDLRSFLDCLAPAAAAGIGTGRMAGFFSNDDKGNLVFEEEKWQRLPLSFPVEDPVTGAVEWRFASFIWEAAAGFVICAVLFGLVFSAYTNRIRLDHGDIFMAFLSLFGATQASLESTRYDALYMRSNGFISMMQMVALVMILIPPVYYTVLAIKNRLPGGKLSRLLISWGVILAALGGAGTAEYFIQRKSGLALWIYPIQMLLLIGACAATVVLAGLSRAEKKKQAYAS